MFIRGGGGFRGFKLESQFLAQNRGGGVYQGGVWYERDGTHNYTIILIVYRTIVRGL